VRVNGTVLAHFCDELNGGGRSDRETLLFSSLRREGHVDHERPWMMVLRYTDTPKTRSKHKRVADGAWQTGIFVTM
jgi:hypothetical protein